MSARQVAELFEYVRRNPIDDQSNFHYPIAALHATFVNLNQGQGASPKKMRDFLLFRDPDDDVEDNILNGDW